MDRKKSKVSIIVPIYNAEKYLKQCIDSICNQTYDNLEIILVDDGSSDRSLEICNAYVDMRIKVLHMPNKGVSAARNAGLKVASGEYIIFVDSDDLLEKGIIEKVLSQAKGDKQLIQWNYYFLKDGNKEKAPRIYGNKLDHEKVVASAIGGYEDDFFLGHYFRAVWGKLFYREIIIQNSLLFDEDLYIGEDAVFLIKYLKFVDYITLLNEYGYVYRITATSAVRRFKTDLEEQSIFQLQKVETLLQTEHVTGAIQESMAMLSWGIYNAMQENYLLGSFRKQNHKDIYSFLKTWCHKNKWIKKKLSYKNGVSRYVFLESVLYRYISYNFVFLITFLYAKLKIYKNTNF